MIGRPRDKQARAAVTALTEIIPGLAVDVADYGQQVAVANPLTRRGCFVAVGRRIVRPEQYDHVVAFLTQPALSAGQRNSRDDVYRFVR